MKITVLVVGSLKTSWLKEGCAEYAGRLAHDGKFSIVELPAGKQKDARKQRDEESVAILKKLDKNEGRVWVLDERGKSMISVVFAKRLQELSDRGESVTFVIGGAYGLSDAVRDRADTLLRLSDMTLPHELCRVLFLEQLYRAVQITKGTGYHHDD